MREAAHQAIRDAIFLVELVLRLNSVAEETVRIEGLRYAALFWEMRALAAEAELARGREHPDADHTIAERWQAWREGSTGLAAGLFLNEEARALLERRYLEGTPTLFPDLAADWLRLCEQAERLAGLGDLVDVTAATVDGARRRRGERPADRRSTCTNSVPRPSRARPTRRRPWSTRLGLRPSIPLATPTVWQPSRNAGCAPNAVPESSWRSESHPRDSDASAWSPRMDSNRPRRP